MGLEDFDVLQSLGAGHFARVDKVKRKLDDKIYALKRLNIQDIPPKDLDDSLNEIRILVSFKHPRIIRCYETFFTDDSTELCIVMEYCPFGDLDQKIRRFYQRRKLIDEREIWVYAINILEGLVALHQKGVVHRDLKPANCLIDAVGCVKIADMNISKVSKGVDMKSQVGTPYFMSPEIYMKQPYSTTSDIWSLGCVLYDLAAQRPPFHADSIHNLKKAVVKGTYEPIPSVYSSDLSAIINRFMAPSPADRPEARDALNDPIIAAHKYLLRYPLRPEDEEADSGELFPTIRATPDPTHEGAKLITLPAPAYDDSADISATGGLGSSGARPSSSSGRLTARSASYSIMLSPRRNTGMASTKTISSNAATPTAAQQAQQQQPDSATTQRTGTAQQQGEQQQSSLPQISNGGGEASSSSSAAPPTSPPPSSPPHLSKAPSVPRLAVAQHNQQQQQQQQPTTARQMSDSIDTARKTGLLGVQQPEGAPSTARLGTGLMSARRESNNLPTTARSTASASSQPLGTARRDSNMSNTNSAQNTARRESGMVSTTSTAAMATGVSASTARAGSIDPTARTTATATTGGALQQPSGSIRAGAALPTISDDEQQRPLTSRSGLSNYGGPTDGATEGQSVSTLAEMRKMFNRNVTARLTRGASEKDGIGMMAAAAAGNLQQMAQQQAQQQQPQPQQAPPPLASQGSNKDLLGRARGMWAAGNGGGSSKHLLLQRGSSVSNLQANGMPAQRESQQLGPAGNGGPP